VATEAGSGIAYAPKHVRDFHYLLLRSVQIYHPSALLLRVHYQSIRGEANPSTSHLCP
jgi:hypothetical protein